jgi:Dyp-type peroxidase family
MVRRQPVELDDLQGNILRAYRYPMACHLFVRIGEPAAGRAWLREVAGHVTSAVPWNGRGPTTTTNLAFTFAGLGALGVAPAVLDSFPEDFREGMAARAALLGDAGPSAPANWHPGLGRGDAHVLLSVYGRDAAALAAAVAAVHEGVEAADGAAVVHERETRELRGSREHFGFDDGFGQPAVAGVRGNPTARGMRGLLGWRSLPVGEFVLGYRDGEGALPAAPAGGLGLNATYLVYREYAQDVAGFRRFTDATAAALGEDEEWVAARIVGRWRDGTPLALSPDRPDPRVSGDRVRINDFDYGDDPHGARCPLGAHVRRANPRDGIPFGKDMTKRHRMIRRGMPYGPPLPPGADDDGIERGLLFLCFNADLERQFEFIQREWILDGNVFGLGRDVDPLLGDGAGTGKMTVPGNPPRFLAPLPRFVTVRGGEYLFVPSRRGLASLTAGAAGRGTDGVIDLRQEQRQGGPR